MELLLTVIALEYAGLLMDDWSLFKCDIGMLLNCGEVDYSNVYHRDFEIVILGSTQEFISGTPCLFSATPWQLIMLQK